MALNDKANQNKYKLEAVQLKVVKDEDDNGYIALKRFTKKIKKFWYILKGKDWHDAENFRLITTVLVRTDRKANTKERISARLSSERLLNTLYKFIHELGAYHVDVNGKKAAQQAGTKISLWFHNKKMMNGA